MADSPVFLSERELLTNPPRGATTVVVHTQPSFWRSWTLRLLALGLFLSVVANVVLFAAYQDYFSDVDAPTEKFRSGDATATNRLAVLEVTGTIMPPFTERLIKRIRHCAKTDSIKGVLLEIDSPGGIVADSHQIYHELTLLRQKKPVYIQMKRMAASGGYYISMGAGPEGKIFAEPTTWTGSIGVIIPRYNISELAKKVGVDSEPLKTGEFKDALSPFRALSDRERGVWENILTQAFDTFVEVIDTNRDNLTAEQVKAVATGEVFTAKDALAKGLIDQIGFESDAIAALTTKVGGGPFRVVSYESPLTVADLLLGQARAEQRPWDALLEASIPRAMYLCSWLPALPQ